MDNKIKWKYRCPECGYEHSGNCLTCAWRENDRLAAELEKANKELEDRRIDILANTILAGLMLRWKEDGYTDASAIQQAYSLANDFILDTAARKEKVCEYRHNNDAERDYLILSGCGIYMEEEDAQLVIDWGYCKCGGKIKVVDSET